MPDTDDLPPFAAVTFDAEDAVAETIIAGLAGFSAARVVGYLQGRNGPQIVLTALHAGRAHGPDRRVISQNLGPGSSGCKLDPGALAEVAGWLLADLADRPDLLVLNRFGKAEGEGGGLRAVLERAMAEGVPVLVPVAGKHLPIWRDYSGGLAPELPCEAEAIRRWAGALPGLAV